MISAIIVCVTAVAALLAAEWAESNIAKAASKMAAASAFIAMALAAGALQTDYGRILLAGLALCWLGDACLLSRGRSTGFLLGIAAFLLGHLFYAGAFFRLGLDPFGLFAGAAVMGAFALLSLRWLRPHVPNDFRIAVLCYVLVISIMVTASIGAVADGATPMLAIGAIGFATSDLFVARERFVEQGFSNSAIGLPLYFGSQMLLAYTVGL